MVQTTPKTPMMSRMRTWQRFSIFILLGMLLSWLISCGGPSSTDRSATNGTAEVEFWTMQLQPKFTSYFEDLIASFEGDHPDKQVSWVDVPWSAMQSKILTAVSAKTAPDVVNLNPDFAFQLASRNAWLTLDDKITPEARDRYLPKIWQASTLNGESFGIPWYLTSRIAIYNTQLFQQADIKQPPKTYAELATAAKQIKEKTGKYAFFITLVPEDSAELMEALVQMGVELVDQSGNAAFNTPAGKAAFEYWIDLYKDGLLPKEVLTQGHRRAIELYQAGETALLSSSPEFLSTIATNAPDIAEVSASSSQITGETGKKAVAVMNLVIPRDTQNPDAALDFALFVTNNENQLAFAKAANVLPSTVDALEDEYFQSVPEDAAAADKARLVSAQQLEDAEVLVPPLPDIKQLQKILYENLQAAMLGEKSADEALADAEEAWNSRS